MKNCLYLRIFSLSILFLVVFSPFYSIIPQTNVHNKKSVGITQFQINPRDLQSNNGFIDSPLINSSQLFLNSNEAYLIIIPADQALQNLIIENARLNHTNQYISNSNFENSEEEIFWTLNSSTNKTTGLSLNQTFIENPEDQLLEFQINGTNSWEHFTPFDQTNNKEEFNTLDRWLNHTFPVEFPSDYALTINPIFAIQEKPIAALESKLWYPLESINYVWGEINHTFKYSGEYPINTVEFNFSYAFEIPSNNNDTVNLTVWWAFEDGSRILIEDWFASATNRTEKSIAVKKFNSNQLKNFFIPGENSTLIFRFEHNNPNSEPASTIWIDDIYFACNYTGRDFKENEKITLNYQTEIDSEIISDPIFAFDAIINPELQMINFSHIEFGIWLNNYSYPIGTLTDIYNEEIQHFSFAIPLSAIPQKLVRIGWYFRFTSPDIRFNATQQWTAYFDNITFHANVLIDTRFANITFQPFTIDNNNYRTIIPSIDGTQANISIRSSDLGWTSDQNPTLKFQINGSMERYTLIGMQKLEAITWRDYLLQKNSQIEEELQIFLDNIGHRIESIPVDWNILFDYRTIFGEIQQGNLLQTLMNSIDKDPRLGYQLISYLTYHSKSNSNTISEQIRQIAEFWNQTHEFEAKGMINSILSEKILQMKNQLINQSQLFRLSLNQEFTSVKPNGTDLGQIRMLSQNIANVLNQSINQDLIHVDIKIQSQEYTYDFSTFQTLYNLFQKNITILGENLIIPWVQMVNWQEKKTNITAGYPAFFSERISGAISSIEMSIGHETLKLLGMLEILFQFTSTLTEIQEFYNQFTTNLIDIPAQSYITNLSKARILINPVSTMNYDITHNRIISNQSLFEINMQLQTNISLIPWDSSQITIVGQIWLESSDKGKFQQGPQFTLDMLSSNRINATTLKIPINIPDSLYLSLWYTQNHTISKSYSNPILILWIENSNQKSEPLMVELDVRTYNAGLPLELWRETLVSHEITLKNQPNSNYTIPTYRALSHIILPKQICIPLQWSTKISEFSIPLGGIDLLNSSRLEQQEFSLIAENQSSLNLFAIKTNERTIIGTQTSYEMKFDFEATTREEFPLINIKTKSQNSDSDYLSIVEKVWMYESTWSTTPNNEDENIYSIQMQITSIILPPLREQLNSEMISIIFWITIGLIASGIIFFKRIFGRFYPFINQSKSKKMNE